MSSGILRICGIVSLLFGVGVSLWGVRTIRDAYASKNWPTTEGKVLDSIVEFDPTRTIQPYEQQVYYAYSVNGARYTSDRVGFGTGRTTLPATPESSEERTRRFLRDPKGTAQEGLPGGSVVGYPAGHKLTVYYKPDDPKVAALVPGATGESFLPLAGGIIIAGVGLLVTLTGRPVG